MRDKSIHLLTILAVLVCLMWVEGCTLQNKNAPTPLMKASPAVTTEVMPTTIDPVVEDGKFHMLALGDSLAKGFGDPDGKGFIGYLADHLNEKLKKEVLIENYGVPGQDTSSLSLSLQLDSFISLVKIANVIVISTGGNDLFQGGTTKDALNPTRVQKLEDIYAADLDNTLKQLRAVNMTARIILIGLYNSSSDLKDGVNRTQIIKDWNSVTDKIAANSQRIVLVPTFDLFQTNAGNYLADDHSHPNAAGHRLIANRIAALIAEW